MPSAPSVSSWRGPLAITAAQCLERIAFYSLAALAVVFGIASLGLSAATSAALVLVWQSACFASPLLTCWLADHLLGRYRAILMSTAPYAVGLLALIASAAFDSLALSFRRSMALFGLVLTALGQVQVHTITFGADQFLDKPLAQRQSYFNWTFFSINAGALVSFTLVAYIGQNHSLAVAFTLSLAMLLCAAASIFFGRKHYHYIAPSKPYSLVLDTLTLAYHTLRSTSTQSWWARSRSLRTASGHLRFQPQRLASIERFVRSLPVLLTFVIFWCIWSQTTSVFVAQGTVLRLRLHPSLPLIPAAALNVCNTLTVVLLTPLFDRVIYPKLRAVKFPCGPLRRIGAGYLLMTLAALYAALIEVYRLYVVRQGYTVTQWVGDKKVEAADVSVLAQAPAYALIGVGEILAAVSGTEYAYAAVPASLGSSSVALFWSLSATGTLLGGTLVAGLTLCGWFATDLNASHLDYYYFLLASLSAVNTIVLVFIAYTPSCASASVPEDADTHGDGLLTDEIPELDGGVVSLVPLADSDSDIDARGVSAELVTVK